MTERAYALQMTAHAKEDIRRLDKGIARRVMVKLLAVAQDPAKFRHKALSGDLGGLYSLRIGSYRALYRLDHDTRLLVVERIGHRREIYRD